MITLTQAIGCADAPAEGATVPLARAALESLARAMDGAENGADNLAFVADMLQAAEDTSATGRYHVLALDAGDDARVHVIVDAACVTIDVRDMRTGRHVAPPVAFVTIAGAPRKLDAATETPIPLANLEFLTAQTRQILDAARHQASLPDGVVSMAAWRQRD